MKQELIDAIVAMDEDRAIELAAQMLDSGAEPTDVLDACSEAMAIVGDLYEAKEYYLPELVIAGDMLTAIGEIVKPRLKGEVEQTKTAGKVLVGTVAGDIHDIGKDIVVFMLDVNNFEVNDLGVDVPAAKFVSAIRDFQPEVVALSGFLTMAFDQMKKTVQAIEEAGLRNKVKIMIGGAPMDENVARYIGADAYGADATAAVKLAKGWIGA